MPTKVLVALDFGDPSLEALRQARALAHGLGGTLSVCHVLPRVRDLSLLFPQGGVLLEAEHITEARDTREDLVQHARAKLGLELGEVFIERGEAHAEIVRRAQASGADFIAIGSHGRAGLARVLLGSVAERVVRHAHCSVLVARAASKRGVVVAATDLSDPSLPAITAGAEVAKMSGARLIVVSALEGNDSPAVAAAGVIGAIPALPSPELHEQRRDTLRSILEQALERLDVAGEVRVLDGPAASAIVGFAAEQGAELVVVGTRGRTGLSRLALGSVAERVIRDASCSVLAVRATPAH